MIAISTQKDDRHQYSLGFLAFLAFLAHLALKSPVAAQDIVFCNTEARNAENVKNDCNYNVTVNVTWRDLEAAWRSKEYRAVQAIYEREIKFSSYRPIGDAGNRLYGYLISALDQTGDYRSMAVETLNRERFTARGSYELWSDLALSLRGVATDESVLSAVEYASEIYEAYPSKINSMIWPFIPRSTVINLLNGRHAVYRSVFLDQSTERHDLEYAIRNFSDDKFKGVAFYALGMYEEAISSDGPPIFDDIFHYAAGYDTVSELFEEVREYQLNTLREQDGFKDFPGDYGRNKISWHPPDILDDQTRGKLRLAEENFQYVIQTYPRSLHADDAAFWLAWSMFLRGEVSEPLDILSTLNRIGNQDYYEASISLTIDILLSLSPSTQYSMVRNRRALQGNPAIWYVVCRSAYHMQDYELAAEIAEEALNSLGIEVAELRESENSSVRFSNIDPNLVEIPYILTASKQLIELNKNIFLDSREFDESDILEIFRVSDNFAYNHKDFRTAILIVENVMRHGVSPQGRQAALYKLARYSSQWDPPRVEEYASLMETEFPSSDLLDDIWAEVIFVKTTRYPNDITGALQYLEKMKRLKGERNALDNSMNWIAIAIGKERDENEAKDFNLKIIREFPNTRFAFYALMRWIDPDGSAMRELDWKDVPKYRVTSEVTYYGERASDSDVLGRLPIGSLVWAYREKDGWLELALGNNYVVFAPSVAFECISDCPN